MNISHYYIIEIQYLGFRFHGWFEQEGLKTIQFMVNKTLLFILKDKKFRTLGASRTDSKASANHMIFELFLEHKIPDLQSFLANFNQNLPNDIRALNIKQTHSDFNIIQTSKKKEYVYLFAFGEKPHPFSVPLVTTFKETLDLKLMKQGALLYEGTHNFQKYCSKPSTNTKFEKTILYSEIKENTLHEASFFPKKTYAFHVHSKGFLRYQVRLMMGQLVRLGLYQINLEEFKDSLKPIDHEKIPYIVPASGLILNKTHFDY